MDAKGEAGVPRPSPETKVLDLPFNEIPQVTVKILKDRNGPVDFFLGFSNKLNPLGFIQTIVPPEIVRVQKQQHPTARLVTNPRFLLLGNGARQKKLRRGGASRTDNDPPLVLFLHERIFYKPKSQGFHIKPNGIVVVL